VEQSGRKRAANHDKRANRRRPRSYLQGTASSCIRSTVRRGSRVRVRQRAWKKSANAGVFLSEWQRETPSVAAGQPLANLWADTESECGEFRDVVASLVAVSVVAAERSCEPDRGDVPEVYAGAKRTELPRSNTRAARVSAAGGHGPEVSANVRRDRGAQDRDRRVLRRRGVHQHGRANRSRVAAAPEYRDLLPAPRVQSAESPADRSDSSVLLILTSTGLGVWHGRGLRFVRAVARWP
jgi:hypothetical protein